MITFKYKNKIISTPNLEKKLKRMKISIDDIEIIPEKEIVIEQEDEPTKEAVYLKHPSDNLIRMCYVNIGEKPEPYELFKNYIWNGKTGIKGYTEEFIKQFYYI